MSEQKTLTPVSSEAMNLFKRELQEIVSETVSLAMLKKEDVEHHGERAEQLIGMGLTITARMLESIMPTGQAILLEDQLKWVVERLPHDGVQPMQVVSRLNMLADVTAKKIPAPHSTEIIAYIDYMAVRIKEISDAK